MSAADRLRWYRKRLASMSPAEVAHRLLEQGKRAGSRLVHPAFAVEPPARLPTLPGLSPALWPRPLPAALVEDWREVAERARTGRFRFLGVDWPGGTGMPPWHLDPPSGRAWPADLYCFAIDHRHAPGLGDIKHAWELGRLQYLQPVAALAAVESDAELAELVAAHVESWIDANPPFRGIGWSSGIELGLRAVSLLVLLSLVPEAFSAAQRGKVWRTLAAHGYWLARFPSRFSSANNHLVAEAGGLYLLGTLAPELPGAARWARYGRATLLAEMERQILPDGAGAEQSPTYEAFTLEWMLLFAAVARAQGDALTPAFQARIAAAVEFLSWISDAGGGQPRIGDDDEGRVLVSCTHEEGYVASVLAAAAAMSGRPLAAPPHRPHLRDFVLGEPAAAAPPPLGLRSFADGGYTVARAREAGGRASMLVLDHGPLGYLSIAAHGHADALALWLHVGDLPVLIDGGTYLYHAGGAWRDHFRGTAAHSTLMLEGADSSRIAGAFNWGERAAATPTRFVEDGDRWRIAARHDGYRRRFGLDHHRSLERSGSGPIILTDWLEAVVPGSGAGSGPQADQTHAVEVGFLINPALTVRRDGDAAATICDASAPVLTVAHEGPLQMAVQSGEEDPRRGWFSPAFGIKVAAPRLLFRGRVAAAQPCRFVLTLLPGH